MFQGLKSRGKGRMAREEAAERGEFWTLSEEQAGRQW